jgi:hypothetical protein
VKHLQVFRRAPPPVRALPARLRQCAAVSPDLLRRQFAHIGQILFDQAAGEFVETGKIIRRVKKTVFPVKTQPADVGPDGIYIFNILF